MDKHRGYRRRIGIQAKSIQGVTDTLVEFALRGDYAMVEILLNEIKVHCDRGIEVVNDWRDFNGHETIT
jgi:hypothetical protein